jgi:glycosyltransferase involved in cell wall biosynthesis
MGLSFLHAIGLLFYLGATGRLGIVHLHMNSYGSALRKGILGLLGNMVRAPVIVHLHGADFRDFYIGLPRPLRKAIRFVLNRARNVVVLGDAWRDFLVVDVGVEPQKISVIRNGVRQPEHVRPTASPPDQAVQITFLGRLGDRKGVPDLLAALQSQRLFAKRWTATIAGDGAVQDFRASVVKAGLQDRVRLPGWVDRDTVGALLRQTDIFVLPSHHEAMPIAILEALAYGVAVVATPVGAIPEILLDGATALLVPPGAPDQLADAIARLIDDPEERRRLGAAGHQVFCNKLEISAVADRFLTLYDLITQIAI